jgi:hypothetical protein
VKPKSWINRFFDSIKRELEIHRDVRSQRKSRGANQSVYGMKCAQLHVRGYSMVTRDKLPHPGTGSETYYIQAPGGEILRVGGAAGFAKFEDAYQAALMHSASKRKPKNELGESTNETATAPTTRERRPSDLAPIHSALIRSESGKRPLSSTPR